MTLIEKLQSEYNHWCAVEDENLDSTKGYIARGHQRAFKTSIELVRSYTSWTSIKEENNLMAGHKVLVCDANNSYDVWTAIVQADGTFEPAMEYGEVFGHRTITHWMPLPEEPIKE